ncbi:hypothetical protein [Spirosoma pomorum]
MRKAFFNLLLVFCFTSSFGQSINGVSLKDINAQYVQIVATTKYAEQTALEDIKIDFGQALKVAKKKMEIRDERGRLLQFTSMIDALNFMTANGYEFIQAYSVTNRINSSYNSNVHYYILRRKSR